ncbi:MAG: hypothetical protein IH957_00255 [Chloroflexi bacterium]|nr:hypothetical protein [Chloroflexota bacterium]
MRFLAVPAAFIALLAFFACSDDEGEDSKLDVTLGEFFIDTTLDTVPPGDVTFDIENDGPDLDHELIIIRTDFGIDELPTENDGTVDERAAGMDVKGRIEKVDPDRKTSGTFSLTDPGAYVLICNLKDRDDEPDASHYADGMRIAFTVEEFAVTSE